MVTLSKFQLDGKVAIITGGAGLLGVKHAETIAEAGGTPVLWDVDDCTLRKCVTEINTQFGSSCIGMVIDIADEEAVVKGLDRVVSTLGRIDILINNAANNPKVEPNQNPAWSRLENFPTDIWNNDLAVGLTGAYLCSKHVGGYMARHGGGSILNIASDLAVIAPDQRIYRSDGLAEDEQPVKPVTYSVTKHGLIGLTKYLATYWAEKNVRVNSFSPGGVYVNQPDDFVQRLTSLIPMGRMADVDEYQGAILFLVSEASSYMTGTNLSMDGGRTCW